MAFPDENIPLDEIELQEQLERVDQAVQLEARRIANYAPLYEQTHPRPIPPVINPYVREEFNYQGTGFFEEKGIEAVVFTLATIGGILYSAIRTAGIFAIAEARLLTTYAITGATQSFWSGAAGISAIAIVEGVLAGFGWIRGKKSGRVNTSWTPIVVAGAIAALAGVLPSFELVSDTATLGRLSKDSIYNAILWLLVLFSGPGIGYLVYVVDENFGIVHNEWQTSLNRRIADHEADQNRKEAEHNRKNDEKIAAYEAAEAAWVTGLNDDYRNKARPSLYREERFGARRRTKSNGHVPPAEEQRPISRDEMRNVQAEVQRWLEDNRISPHAVGVKEGDIASPKQIAMGLGYFADNRTDLPPEQRAVDSKNVRVALNRLRKIMA